MKLNVKGMACSGCEKRIKNALMQLDEVENVEASFESGIVDVELKKDIDKKVIEDIIDDIGFEVIKGE